MSSTKTGDRGGAACCCACRCRQGNKHRAVAPKAASETATKTVTTTQPQTATQAHTDPGQPSPKSDACASRRLCDLSWETAYNTEQRSHERTAERQREYRLQVDDSSRQTIAESQGVLFEGTIVSPPSLQRDWIVVRPSITGISYVDVRSWVLGAMW